MDGRPGHDDPGLPDGVVVAPGGGGLAGPPAARGARAGGAAGPAAHRHPPPRLARQRPRGPGDRVPAGPLRGAALASEVAVTTVRRVLAPNPGPFTGPGTNTWVLGDPPVCAVIDPGPDDEGHLAAIDQRLGAAAVGAVLLTHGHGDHVDGAERFAARHQVRVLRHPELADGDVVHVGPLSLGVLYTPGHAPDHVAFWLAEDRVLFTGDLILGQG